MKLCTLVKPAAPRSHATTTASRSRATSSTVAQLQLGLPLVVGRPRLEGHAVAVPVLEKLVVARVARRTFVAAAILDQAALHLVHARPLGRLVPADHHVAV